MLLKLATFFTESITVSQKNYVNRVMEDFEAEDDEDDE